MEWITGLAALIGVIQLIWKHRQAVRAHPSYDYQAHSLPNPQAASWRWRQPEASLGLSVIDSESRSVLLLPESLRFLDVVLQSCGVLFALLLLWLPFAKHPDVDWTLIILPASILALLSWLFLNFNAYVVRIELQADKVVLVLRYGLRLYRQVSIKASPRLQFNGDYQSFLEMNQGQETPDFKMKITKTKACWLCATHQRVFYLRCDRSQGSWVVGGLQAWQQGSL